MKNKLKVVIAIAGAIVFLSIIALISDVVLLMNNAPSRFYFSDRKNTLEGIIVKVNGNSLTVMSKANQPYLYDVAFTSEGNIGFKRGQEVLIFYGSPKSSHITLLLAQYPSSLGKTGKIKILKEKSDIQIPDSVLRFCYNSPNNVQVKISELTNHGMNIELVDNNEVPYNYTKYRYILNKKVKDLNYVEKEPVDISSEKFGSDIGMITNTLKEDVDVIDVRYRERISMAGSKQNCRYSLSRYRSTL